VKKTTKIAQAIQLVSVARPTLLPMEAPANEETMFDSKVAETSYGRYAAAWSKLSTEGMAVPRQNIEYALARVIQCSNAIQAPTMRARFARLPEFSMDHVDELGPVAWALWHCRVQSVTVSGAGSEALLPSALVTKATRTFKTMTRVIEYNLVDDEDESDPIADELASMRAKEGSRYLRLAQSLSRLAALYRDPRHAEALALDKRRYDASDAERAQDLSGRILLALGSEDTAGAFWTKQVVRGWNVLDAHYAEVRRGGLYLEHGHDAERSFPALSALRPPAARAAKKPAKVEETEESPKDG
jgi:hypothetical protein